jgi:hypothetical protein
MECHTDNPPSGHHEEAKIGYSPRFDKIILFLSEITIEDVVQILY